LIDPIEHGGADGGPAIAHDFSTNANPLGPPPQIAGLLGAADRTRYPDPQYAALRERLALWHGVAPERVLPSAGTSEAIRRLTLAAFVRGVRTVWLPRPGYGDYAAAAGALGLTVRGYASGESLLQGLRQATAPELVWLCEPCNPTGESAPAAFWPALADAAADRPVVIALDSAYEPLRLDGACPIPLSLAQFAWQCVSPNKALGVTGVRAGYVLAPAQDELRLRPSVESLAPSWVLSAEGVAVLDAWPAAETRAWLQQSLLTLTRWKQAQHDALDGLGWHQQMSVVPFWLAQPREQGDALQARLQHLRGGGIKLRDAASFGLPGWLRVSVQPLPSQRALVQRWGVAATPSFRASNHNAA
jgi:histidinol-phosphate aminotransferase